MHNYNLKNTSAGRIVARSRQVWPVFLLLKVIIVATIGFMLLDPRYSFVEALYMTFITITTVGYREVYTPQGWLEQLWTILVICGGIVSGTAVVSMIGAMIVEGRVRTVLGRRQLQRKIEGLSGHVIVCGYGLMGAQVAQQLRSGGKSVVVIDMDTDRTQLADSYGYYYIVGNAHDEETLRQAGIRKASALVATLKSDAENVFLTLSARVLSEKINILARARGESATDKLYKAGATTVICPHTVGASKMANTILRPAVVDFVEVAGKGIEIEMDQLELVESSPLVGKSLQELALPKKAGVQVCAVQRKSGQTYYQPAPDFILKAGDVLVLVGKTNSKGVLAKLGF